LPRRVKIRIGGHALELGGEHPPHVCGSPNSTSTRGRVPLGRTHSRGATALRLYAVDLSTTASASASVWTSTRRSGAACPRRAGPAMAW